MKRTLLLATALLTCVYSGYVRADDFGDELSEELATEMLAQLVSNTTETNNVVVNIQNNLPEIEQKFIDIAAKYQNEIKSSSVKNDIQKRMLLKKRTAEFNALNFDGKLTGWKGTVTAIETSGDRIYIDVEIAPKIKLRYYTNIEDSLIDKLAAQEVENNVIISGRLKPDRNDKGFEELSWTTDGSLKDPEFDFTLTDIEVAQ